MKKSNFWVLPVMLFILPLFFSGCGGGGSSSAPENEYNQYEQEQNDDEKENFDFEENSAYYIPHAYSEEELIAMAADAVPLASFDVSLLEENEYNEYNSENGITSSAADLETLRAKRIVRAMWRHAVKLAVFPNSVDVPYQQEGKTIRLNQTTTTHSISQSSTQKRFLYVYPYYDNPPVLETFPYRQYVGNCQHYIMGTDCVGFIYHCAYEATKNYYVKIGNKTVKGLRMRRSTNDLGNASTWTAQKTSSDSQLFPNAKLITDKSKPPKPGDILVWSGHVGIAVRINSNTIGVAHSTGLTSYTCSQFFDYASHDVDWVGYPSERIPAGAEGVNGFVVHEYNNYIKNHAPGKCKETYRVRLEETEYSDEFDDAVIGKLSGIWKPVDAKFYITSYNDYGIPVETKEMNFVRFNPDKPANSSSFSFDVSAEKITRETDYQSLKPEYLISCSGRIWVCSRSGNDVNIYINEDIFGKNYGYTYRLSGDVLISDSNSGTPGSYGNYEGRISTVSFPDESSMKIVDSISKAKQSGKITDYFILDLERSDGNEKPEADKWLEKLSGDWIPADYSFTLTFTSPAEKHTYKFVPYDPDEDENSVSSKKIKVTPRRELNWYEIENSGYVTASEITQNSICYMQRSCIFGDGHPLYVSGDVLIAESDSNSPVSHKTLIETPDDNSLVITISNESDYEITSEYIELRRK